MTKSLPDDAFVGGRKEVIVESQGKKIKFFANEIGFLASQNISVSALRGKNSLALLVSESIEDESGNKFTYEEVMRMKKEYAGPLFDAVAEVNGYNKTTEKKS